MGEKCSFSFISFFDPDVVISPANIYNGELGASAEAVNDLRNKRGYIPVNLFIGW